MKALVFGHGFLGSWLAKLLCDLGFEVTVFTRSLRPNQDTRIRRFIIGNATDRSAVLRAMMSVRPDMVFNAIAVSTLGQARLDRMETFAVNTMAALNIFEAAVTGGVSCLVHASSDKTIGACRRPATEDAPYKPYGEMYSLTKILADICATKLYAKLIPMVVIRAVNLFGQGDANLDRLIPSACTKAALDEPIVLHRNSIRTRREYIYVEPAARAIIELALKRLDGTLSHVVYNIGSDDRFTSLEVAKRILAVAGKDPDNKGGYLIVDSPLDAVSLGSQAIDSTRLRAELPTWRPTPFDEGLRIAYGYYRGLARGTNEFRTAA